MWPLFSLGADKVINYIVENLSEKIAEYKQNKEVNLLVNLDCWRLF
ncbi:MAG: hypothetical protein ACEY3J_01415 [Arsenophonus sp.]